MAAPNEELTQRILAALQKASLVAPAEIEKLGKKILTGKIKAEDWYAVIENSLPDSKEGSTDGN